MLVDTDHKQGIYSELSKEFTKITDTSDLSPDFTDEWTKGFRESKWSSILPEVVKTLHGLGKLLDIVKVPVSQEFHETCTCICIECVR